jgi:hypothetical protein
MPAIPSPSTHSFSPSGGEDLSVIYFSDIAISEGGQESIRSSVLSTSLEKISLSEEGRYSLLEDPFNRTEYKETPKQNIERDLPRE